MEFHTSTLTVTECKENTLLSHGTVCPVYLTTPPMEEPEYYPGRLGRRLRLLWVHPGGRAWYEEDKEGFHRGSEQATGQRPVVPLIGAKLSHSLSVPILLVSSPLFSSYRPKVVDNHRGFARLQGNRSLPWLITRVACLINRCKGML